VEFGISQLPLEFGISKAKTKEQVDPTILFWRLFSKISKASKSFFRKLCKSFLEENLCARSFQNF
jgi:hypothetical protein